MQESSAERRLKLLSGRYCFESGQDGEWRVTDPAGRDVFPEQTFPTANEAGAALAAVCADEGLDCLILSDRERHSAREAIVGDAAKRFRDEGSVLLKLNVSPELDASINNMGEELGVPRGQTIVKALELLKVAMDAKREGKRVAIIDDNDDSEQDITGF